MVNENVSASELASRQNRKVMIDCVDALGDYAALLIIESSNTTAARELRELVSGIVQYWGLDIGENANSVEDFLSDFDERVDFSGHIRTSDIDTFSVCSNILTGLAQHGMDVINSQGSDAMYEILKTADLLNEVGDYFGFTQETEFAKSSARQFRNSVTGMLKEYDLPGSVIEEISNQNYVVKQAVLFDNNRGFAFAHNPEAASPFVTWQMYNNDGKLEYEWGNYFSSQEKALVDYITRHANYIATNKVNEIAFSTTAEPEHDVRRMYKAEISLPDEEYPHLEVFSADNDVDAVKEANELCNEREGSYLLEVHELTEDYDSIRQIDLRYHDPEARRFMDVDIIEFLKQIADKTIIHYPGDFTIDENELWKAALSQNPEDKRLMWHCSSYGTHLLSEDEVFIRDTGAYGYWVDYRPKEPDMVGYTIEITGYRDDSVVGNVYDVGNYYSHSQYVRENALVLDAVSLTYANDWGINAGKTITVPKYEYDNDRHRLMSESGRVTAIKYHPSESTQTMADRLKAEKDKYMGMPVGDTKEHLSKLDEKLRELRGEPTPEEILRIYHADFSDPDILERMEIIAAIDDADALRQAKEICAESSGITLVELNEVDESGDTREVSIHTQAAEIMPDPTITVTERNEYGYDYEGMLPLNQGRAMELYMQNSTVYLLWNDGTESAVHDSSEITNHDGIFGIEREDWHKSNAYKEVTGTAEQSQKKIPALQAAEEQSTKEPAADKPEKPKRKHRGEDR